MLEIFQFEFMQNAFAAALLASIACGIMGSFVYVKRISFISGGIAHAAFGGIGLSYFLGWNPLACLLPFAAVCAILIGFIKRKVNVSEDTAIGIFWSVGMALGIIFISMAPGYAPNLFSYLFGNILTVPHTDLLTMTVLDVVIVAFTVFYYREFLAICFDEEYSETLGLKVLPLYLLLLTLIACSVVMLVRLVGIILVIALLTMPAAIARQWTQRLHIMIFLSVIVSAMITVGGLLLSYYFDVASGATIILTSLVCFGFSSVLRFLKK